MTGLYRKSALRFAVIRRFHEGTGYASNGTGGAKFFHPRGSEEIGAAWVLFFQG
jgi:hypothetical protein